jgi:hypothetical protein
MSALPPRTKVAALHAAQKIGDVKLDCTPLVFQRLFTRFRFAHGPRPIHWNSEAACPLLGSNANGVSIDESCTSVPFCDGAFAIFSARGTFVCAYNVGAANKYVPTKANAGSERAIVLNRFTLVQRAYFEYQWRTKN